jgi:protoporphyrinogen IX oxidase
MNFYLGLKTLHIIAVMSWMAGLLYLPRLFVYHADTSLETLQSETFKVMERRLLNAIMTPALLVSVASGFVLAMKGGFIYDLWFSFKAFCVFLLIGVHMRLYQHMKIFERGHNVHSSRYFRVLNEVPTLLMIVIVALVVFKPT